MKSPNRWLPLFLGPYAIGALVFILGPMVFSIYTSFTDWSLFGSGELVGFKNYVKLFKDPLFGHSLLITCYYVVLAVPTQIVLSVLLAVMLNRKLRGIAFFRAVFFMPYVISLIAVGLIWSWMYSPQFGFASQLFAALGIPSPAWLADPDMAMPSIVIATLWRNVGYYIMIFVAALQSMPSELYEAAKVDGAAPTRIFRSVTLPLLSPTIFFTLVVATIWAWQVFDLTYIMTKGGPGHATLSTGLYIYQTAFIDSRLGYASAQSWALLVIILLLTLAYFKAQKRWVHYENS